MQLFNQIGSLCRRLGEILPTVPLYLESLPETYERPCVLVGVDRPTVKASGPASLISTVTWKVGYLGASFDDVLETLDSLIDEFVDPGFVAYLDYSTTPPTETERSLRVTGIEILVEHDTAGLVTGTCRVTTEFRVPRDITEAPAIAGVHASQSLTGR